MSVRELWAVLEKLRRPHREHRWSDIPRSARVPGLADRRAEYEKKNAPGTRPFWYDPETTDFRVSRDNFPSEFEAT